jgi:type IV secretory pathway VirB10-like protein
MLRKILVMMVAAIGLFGVSRAQSKDITQLAPTLTEQDLIQIEMLIDRARQLDFENVFADEVRVPDEIALQSSGVRTVSVEVDPALAPTAEQATAEQGAAEQSVAEQAAAEPNMAEQAVPVEQAAPVEPAVPAEPTVPVEQVVPEEQGATTEQGSASEQAATTEESAAVASEDSAALFDRDDNRSRRSRVACLARPVFGGGIYRAIGFFERVVQYEALRECERQTRRGWFRGRCLALGCRTLRYRN